MRDLSVAARRVAVPIVVSALTKLALALGLPIVGVVTLRVLAEAAPAPVVATVADAHKGEVYYAIYHRSRDGLRVDRAPDHVTPAVAAPHLDHPSIARCGSGLRRYPEVFGSLAGTDVGETFDLPRASVLARLGRARFEDHGADDLPRLEPLYIRPSDAVLPG